MQNVLKWTLELEALELTSLRDETFEILTDRFGDADDVLTREIQIAIAAKETRAQVVGRTFDPDLYLTDGTRMPISDYRGKVILMPLWAMNLPGSVQVIPFLMQLQAENPDQIAIVGINLDPRDAPVQDFESKSGLTFRSYRSESSAEQSMANPVAQQFWRCFDAICDHLGSKRKSRCRRFHRTKVKVDRRRFAQRLAAPRVSRCVFVNWIVFVAPRSDPRRHDIDVNRLRHKTDRAIGDQNLDTAASVQ